ncbi:DUF934 domain-containing protein [Coralliovum pocilloporae]|uniref:DUF934 domain-containing protein n=1 Tax=Coralliovum pocilloporae TaxID=3066369 RepID=UPI00330750FD
MAQLWKNGEFVDDAWQRLADDEALPNGGQALVSRTRWLAERESLKAAGSIGLYLTAGEELEGLEEDLDLFPVIALDFPKFSDGRSFSVARLLREKCDFKGEIRAYGEVLIDQIAYMYRCGFSTMEVTHEPTRKSLVNGDVPMVNLFMQPAIGDEEKAGKRAWARRPTS